MKYDVIVIGGGPAGLSAAVQARVRNKSVLVVSSPTADLPVWKAERIDNYLGLPGLSGAELMERFEAHAQELGVERRTGRALNAMPMDGGFFVAVDSDVVEGNALVLASGVSQGPALPGELEHLGAGVSYCATCDGMLYRNKDVVVVGKSTHAPEEANYLHGLGCRVTYVSAKAPEGLDPAIPVVQAKRLSILGEGKVSGVEADGNTIPCDGVFLLRSAVAPTQLLPGLELDGPYIRVDRNMATNLPGVFAAGDCTGLPLQISKAVGEGLVAGLRAAEYLDHQ
ncbi:thioredoxin reductase [Flavonifractor sp. An92]|uniref:NAD(P)/FAD-dependent oxidoreductase n=1 Tax=Flavonifractor sp. An92 TaxID=1965666 RepID=UPI000B37454F|nr:NAD(P)/FAD-dependent oxidoreductase [Flavonifractor sp. An92]OUN06393.1 thioredoxin reductase [Flavonifractor sp. An92]